MRGNGIDERNPSRWPDEAVWRRSRLAETAEDEAERLLDLAAFADGRLDADERDRVAEWLSRDPAAAADVAAARALTAAAASGGAAPPEGVVVRACALVGQSNGRKAANVVALPLSAARRHRGLLLYGLARWGSLAAAVVVASWLGFTLGMDAATSASRNLPSNGSPQGQGVLNQLLDPSTGFMRNLTESPRT